jgi:hypothetical protein
MKLGNIYYEHTLTIFEFKTSTEMNWNNCKEFVKILYNDLDKADILVSNNFGAVLKTVEIKDNNSINLIEEADVITIKGLCKKLENKYIEFVAFNNKSTVRVLVKTVYNYNNDSIIEFMKNIEF